MAKRPTFESFKKKALKDPAVKAEYDALAPAYAMKRDMIAKPPHRRPSSRP